MSVCREFRDRLPTLAILKAPQRSSQHLTNPVISRVCEVYQVQNVGKGGNTHFKCRDSVLTVSIQGLQGVRASVLTVSNQFSCIDC